MRVRVAPSSASARTSTASCAASSRRSTAGRAIRRTTRSSTMSGRRSSGACRRSSDERLLVLALLQLGAEQIAEGAEALSRSEERRVGKESRFRWSQEHKKKREDGYRAASLVE